MIPVLIKHKVKHSQADSSNAHMLPQVHPSYGMPCKGGGSKVVMNSCCWVEVGSYETTQCFVTRKESHCMIRGGDTFLCMEVILTHTKCIKY